MIDEAILGGYTDFDVTLDGASINFNTDNVIVPANGEANVKVTLNVPKGRSYKQFCRRIYKF